VRETALFYKDDIVPTAGFLTETITMSYITQKFSHHIVVISLCYADLCNTWRDYSIENRTES